MTYKTSFFSSFSQSFLIFFLTIGGFGIVFGLSGVQLEPMLLLVLFVVVEIIAVAGNYMLAANEVTIDEKGITIKKMVGGAFTYAFTDYFIETKLTDLYINHAKYATTLKVFIHEIKTENMIKGFSLKMQSKKNTQNIVNELYRYQVQAQTPVEELADSHTITEPVAIHFSKEEIAEAGNKFNKIFIIVLVVIEAIIIGMVAGMVFLGGAELSEEILGDVLLLGVSAVSLFGLFLIVAIVQRKSTQKKLNTQMPTLIEFTDVGFTYTLNDAEHNILWDKLIQIVATSPTNTESGMRSFKIQYDNKEVVLFFGVKQHPQFIERYEEILDICEHKLLSQGKIVYDILT